MSEKPLACISSGPLVGIATGGKVILRGVDAEERSGAIINEFLNSDWQQMVLCDASMGISRDYRKATVEQVRAALTAENIAHIIHIPAAPAMNPDDDINEPLCFVVCAAIRHRVTGLIICGPRHFDAAIMRPLMELTYQWDWKGRSETGFIDNKGQFLDRQQAWIVAERAGQIRNPRVAPAGTLYSEHLY